MAEKQAAFDGMEPSWPEFEGQPVTKAILTFAGNVPLTAAAYREMRYMDDTEVVIRGRLTGKKVSHSGDDNVGNVTLTIEEVNVGKPTVMIAGQRPVIVTKAGEKRAKADAEPEPEDDDEPEPEGKPEPPEDMEAASRRATSRTVLDESLELAGARA